MQRRCLQQVGVSVSLVFLIHGLITQPGRQSLSMFAAFYTTFVGSRSLALSRRSQGGKDVPSSRMRRCPLGVGT
jgi:hypothetical protein